MTTKLTAQDKRFAAMQIVIDQVLPDRETGSLVILLKREDIARRILALKTLGRTERWHSAVETWAHVVKTDSHLRWAFLQWSIYAGFDAS